MIITIGNKKLTRGKKSNNRDEDKLVNFVIAYFLMQSLNLYVKLGLNGLSFWEFLSYGILSIFLLVALYAVFKKHMIKGLVLAESVLVLCFVFSWILNESIMNDFYSIAFHSLFVYLPLGWCVYCIDDYSLLLKKLYHVSWPIAVILVFLSFNLVASIYDYYMMLGYSLLLPLLIVADHFLHKKTWYDLIVIIPCFLTMLVVGSRGPFVCLFFFVFLKLLFWENISKRRKIIIFFITLLVGVVFLLSYKPILVALSNIMLRNGISSRTLLFIINGNFTDSGRSELYAFFLDEIKQKPLIGWGIAGGWRGAVYPHNVFIEFLLSFGVLIGSILSALYCLSIFRGITNNNEFSRRIAHIFVAICISLLFSNSFIMEQTFFISLMVCMSRKKRSQLEV